MSLLWKLFSRIPSVPELQDKLKEIDLEQRKRRRDLAMLEETKQQKVNRAVEAKKAGRQDLLKDLFRDVSQVEINIQNAHSDVRRLSLTRTALSSFVRKAELLEMKRDRKSLQKLIARFNDSSILKVIDSASVDDDTFHSMLEDVLSGEEVSATQSTTKENTGFADFDRAISDMLKVEDTGAGDENLTAPRQEAHKPDAMAATRTTNLRTKDADEEALRGIQTQRMTDEVEEALRDRLSQMKDAMHSMLQGTHDMRHDLYSTAAASWGTDAATANLGPHPTGLMDSISGVIAPAQGSPSEERLPDMSFAGRGMWMPQQIPQLAAQLRALGFEGDPNAFADFTGQPMGAIVDLDGGTGSFVSPEGLIVTNRHCVTARLQYNSTPQHNLLKEGFLARTREEELSSGPGQHAYVTTSVIDVTEEIVGDIDPKATDRQRKDIIDRRIKERIAACEKEGTRGRVASFFEGLKYFEIVQLDIKDVRVVYAPAEGIGRFGGETENWRWPRHTGDWSYLRAYVSKDGKSVSWSKDNVPFRPKHWLKVSSEGAKPGDLVFAVGYPGTTMRYGTYAYMKRIAEWWFPRSIRLLQEQLAIIDTLIAGDKALEIKVASRSQGLYNNLTNNRGMLEGLVKGGALAQKQAMEQDLAAWIAANPVRKQKYGDVLPALQALQADSEEFRERKAVMDNLSSASSCLSAAQTLYRLSIQRPKKDLDREIGYQEHDWSRIRETQEQLQRTMSPTVDRAFLGWALGLAAALPAGQRIGPLDSFFGFKAGMVKAEAERAMEGQLDSLYAGTKLFDRDFRLSLLDKSTAELMAAEDSFLLLAAALEPLAESIREADKDRAGASARLRPRYMEALLEKSGGLLAPDANKTLRVSYGQVKGVDARDGLFYKPQTGLRGIIEKQTGEGDFNAPKRQIDAIQNQLAGKVKSPYYDQALKDVPVNFLSATDATGGNSGSPTLNAKGDLVGLLHDGTYESVASKFLFDPVRTRSIHVDSRYMLWVMNEVDGARNLLKELGIEESRALARQGSD